MIKRMIKAHPTNNRMARQADRWWRIMELLNFPVVLDAFVSHSGIAAELRGCSASV